MQGAQGDTYEAAKSHRRNAAGHTHTEPKTRRPSGKKKPKAVKKPSGKKSQEFHFIKMAFLPLGFFTVFVAFLPERKTGLLEAKNPIMVKVKLGVVIYLMKF